MARDNTANWVEIDPSTLSEAQRVAYSEYKDTYKIMKEYRLAFERSMQAGVPEGMRMVLGYNFGKLSAAIVADDRKPAKAKASTQSLADFLKAQGAQGYRS